MIPVQNVIRESDNIFWGDLSPQFRGYQLSNTGLVRSLKFGNKFHFGVIIQQRKDGSYELSNDSNQRVIITVDELQKIVNQNGGYTYPTYIVPNNNRNPICTSKSAYMNKNYNFNSGLQEKVSLHLTITDE